MDPTNKTNKTNKINKTNLNVSNSNVNNLNTNIINQFTLLVEQIKLDIDYSSGKKQLVNMYRLASIKKVLSILEKIKEPITSSEQLKGIKGIGNRSLKRIDEIIKTGKLAEIKISKESLEYLKIITELEDVFGIGRKKAYELFTKYSIKSIDDLKKKVLNKQIDLPDNIIKGLEYVGKINTKIPRNEIDKINEVLLKTTQQIDSQLFGLTCGSYRRGKDTSGDVDFIIVHTNLKTKNDIENSKINYLESFVKKLKQNGIIVDSLTSDNVPTKYMGICRLLNGELCRIDIRLIQYNSFYPAILYFTGSKDLNKKMRSLAESHGYLLNEYGLFDSKGAPFNVKSEKNIFELLGMEYLEPSNR